MDIRRSVIPVFLRRKIKYTKRFACIGLVEAGSETSSVTLHNLILYLAGTPDAQQRIADELSAVVGPHRAPTFTDIPELPYT